MPIITFPNRNLRVAQNYSVLFEAVMDGKNVTCEISERALVDHFAASTHQEGVLLNAFIAGKERIHEVARRKLPQSAGVICRLVSADFVAIEDDPE